MTRATADTLAIRLVHSGLVHCALVHCALVHCGLEHSAFSTVPPDPAAQTARLRVVPDRASVLRARICALVIALAASASTAHAQSPYCRRVQADARSRAYLLMSPSLSVQAVHLPRVGDDTGAGVFQGSGWQGRAALSWSVLDVLRGAWLLDAGGSECRRYEARERVERVLGLGPDVGRLAALQDQLRYLEEQRPAVDELLAQGEERRARQLSTQHQLNTLRLRAAAIDRRIIQLRGEIDRLEAEDAPPDASVRDELDAYEHAALTLEREQSNVRRADAWRLNVRAGVVPNEPLDWFGAVELSYNLGGVAQWLAEDDALHARAEELREARYELRHRVERFERTVRASLDEQERAIALLDAQIELTEQQAGMYAELAQDTGDMQHAWAMVEMNRMELEAERRFRRRLLAEHRRVSAASLASSPGRGSRSEEHDE